MTHEPELRRLLRDVRNAVDRCEAAIRKGDANKAYANAEQAQHAAFDLKDEIKRLTQDPVVVARDVMADIAGRK